MNYHEKYNSFYTSKEWQQLRKAKWLNADGLCEECRKKGIICQAREIHHIIPIERDWSKRLQYSNLIALCPECHRKMHERNGDFQIFEKLWANIDKNLII